MALISYHLLEMPIRNRSLRITPAHLRWVALGSAVLIVAGGVVVGGRDVPAQFGGLESATGKAPVTRDGHRLDVLVITDDAGKHLADDLRRRAASRADLSVTVADPFACDGLTRVGKRMTCRNWRTEWPRLIRSFDPDIVLFHVTHWDTGTMAALSGTTDAGAQMHWAREVLETGFAYLAERDASIVWSYEPFDAANFATAGTPFFLTMNRLTVDTNVLRLQDNQANVDQTVAELQALRRPVDRSLLRVLVVGDSSSRTFGYGLEQWANSTHRALVWSVGTPGCGIANDGRVVDAGREVSVPERCRAVQAGWRSRVARFRPDLVIVMSTIYDTQQRRVGDWPSMLVPGDRAFDDYLTKKYADAYDILSSTGAHVVWMESPCARPSVGPWPVDDRGGPLSTPRVKHVDDVVLARVVRLRPQLRRFDLFRVLCPDGVFRNDIGGVHDFRPDGIHYSPEASLWLARHYGQQILDAGLK